MAAGIQCRSSIVWSGREGLFSGSQNLISLHWWYSFKSPSVLHSSSSHSASGPVGVARTSTPFALASFGERIPIDINARHRLGATASRQDIAVGVLEFKTTQIGMGVF